jgi:hypothetical protein
LFKPRGARFGSIAVTQKCIYRHFRVFSDRDFGAPDGLSRSGLMPSFLQKLGKKDIPDLPLCFIDSAFDGKSQIAQK